MKRERLDRMQAYCEDLLADGDRCTCGGIDIGVGEMHAPGCGLPNRDEIWGLAEFVLELIDAELPGKSTGTYEAHDPTIGKAIQHVRDSRDWRPEHADLPFGLMDYYAMDDLEAELVTLDERYASLRESHKDLAHQLAAALELKYETALICAARALIDRLYPMAGVLPVPLVVQKLMEAVEAAE